MKYCSDRCRHRKPGAIDKRIESIIVALLNGEPDSGIEKTSSRSRYLKGDQRNTVSCDEIAEIVFGSMHDTKKTFSRKKDRASRALEADTPESKSASVGAHEETSSEHSDLMSATGKVGPMIRPPQAESEINGSIGGEKGWAERQDETPEQLTKRREGQRRAEQREMVRRAARRGVVFGFLVPETLQEQPHLDRGRSKYSAVADSKYQTAQPPKVSRRKCEAVMNGSVVEPSFAKGDWAVRWREN